jgi:hypothetical protein
MSDKIMPPRQNADFEPDIQDKLIDIGYPPGTYFNDMGTPFFPPSESIKNTDSSENLKEFSPEEIEDKLRLFIEVDTEVKKIESKQTHKKLLGGNTEIIGPKVPTELWLKRSELLTFFLGNETSFKKNPALCGIFQRFEDYYKKK